MGFSLNGHHNCRLGRTAKKEIPCGSITLQKLILQK